MDERAVVTCFLRHQSAVLLSPRSEAVGSYRGRWGAVSGRAEGDPVAAARAKMREETGLAEEVRLVRRGDPFDVVDGDRGTRWVVHPYMFDCASRAVETDWETADHAWVAPTAILYRETVPESWRSYDAVRPTVSTVAGDDDHGSAYISVRALEVLRDEGAAETRLRGGEDGWDRLADIASSLRAARPAMPVVRNRVDRVMDAASAHRTARAVEHAAAAGIDEAVHADDRAATRTARRVAGARVATLSRSGTVREALELADPEAVLVAESRPGKEGVDVAESLAAGSQVTLATDAAFAHAIGEWEADAVLVGADAVLADGSVVNKAGTRAAAMAGTYEGIEVLVAAASDKITPDDPDLEERDPTEVHDGERPVDVYNPTFDVTPAECVDAVVTERGILDADDVAAVVAGHRERAKWAEE